MGRTICLHESSLASSLYLAPVYACAAPAASDAPPDVLIMRVNAHRLFGQRIGEFAQQHVVKVRRRHLPASAQPQPGARAPASPFDLLPPPRPRRPIPPPPPPPPPPP